MVYAKETGMELKARRKIDENKTTAWLPVLSKGVIAAKKINVIVKTFFGVNLSAKAPEKIKIGIPKAYAHIKICPRKAVPYPTSSKTEGMYS